MDGRHWLIGVYERDGVTLRYCLYGSPTMMAPWMKEKAAYVQPDFDLAEVVPDPSRCPMRPF